MSVRRLDSRNRITLPMEIRNALGLRHGDEVEFLPVDGGFRLRKHVSGSPFDRYVGFLRDLEGRDPDELIEEMRGESDRAP